MLTSTYLTYANSGLDDLLACPSLVASSRAALLGSKTGTNKQTNKRTKSKGVRKKCTGGKKLKFVQSCFSLGFF